MVCPWCEARPIARLAVMTSRPDRIIGQCGQCGWWMDDYATADDDNLWRPMRPEEAAAYQARVARGECRVARDAGDY